MKMTIEHHYAVVALAYAIFQGLPARRAIQKAYTLPLVGPRAFDKLMTEDYALMHKMYTAGMTKNKIAEHFSVKKDRVREILKKKNPAKA